MPRDAMPTATEIFGRPSPPVPWSATAGTLAAAIAILPTLDDVTAGLVEDLALAILDREDELRAVRAVRAAAMTLSQEQAVEIIRLQRRRNDLLDELKEIRTRAHPTPTVRPRTSPSARPRPRPRTTQALNTKNNNNNKDNSKPNASPSPRTSQAQGQGQVTE